MNSIQFQSSQYVPIEFSLANVGLRLGAALIDYIILLIYFFVVALTTDGAIFYTQSNSSMLIFTFFLVKIPIVFYNPLCEYFMKGQTLGKYIVGIRVVTIHGDRPGIKEIFSRWFFKGDFLFFSFSGLVVIWFFMGILAIPYIILSAKNQRLADFIGNTVLIKVKGSDTFKLSDVLRINTVDTHEVKYPEVVRFVDEDMMLIKQTLLRIRENPSEETKAFARELCDETARIIGIEPVESNRSEFLQQVLKDYVVLTR